MTLAPPASPSRPLAFRRPLIPLTLTFLGGAVAAEWWAPPTASVALAVVGLAGAAVLCLWRGLAGPAWASLLSLFAALGFLHQALAHRTPPDSIARLPESALAQPLVVDGIVAAPVERLPPAGQRADARLRLVLDVTAVRGPDGWLPALGRARLTVYEPRGRIRYGDRLRGPVRLRRPRGYLNPAAFDPARYLRAQGIALEGWVATDAVLEQIPQQGGSAILGAVYALREYLLREIGHAFPSPAAGLVKAMLLGDRSDIPEAVNDAFLQSGTYHILAISGLNVSVLAGVLYIFLKLLRVPIRARAAICLLAVTGYAALAGGGASVVRAAVMADVFFLAILLDREADLLNALAIAALGLVLWNPAVIHDVGFLLTFAATLGIVLVVDPSQWGAPSEGVGAAPVAAAARGARPAATQDQGPGRWGALRRAGRWVLEAVTITTAATAATLPVLACFFNRVSLVGLAANLPIVPLSSALTAAGTAAAGFIALIPGGLPPLNWVNEVLVAWLVALAGWFAAVPYASFHLPTPTFPMVLCYYVALAGLLGWYHGAAWRRAARWVAVGSGAGLVILVGVKLAPVERAEGFRATILDVGQGDAIVVELPGRRVMVVDAGGMWDDAFDVGERVVAPYMWWRWIGRIDVLVITHPHPDHANGARALLRNFRVGEVWEPGVPSGLPAAGWVAEWTAQHGIPRHTVRAGFPPRRWGEVEVEALHPPAGALLWGSPRGPASDTNSNSIVLRLGVKGRFLLLAGDLEAEGEAALLAGKRPVEAEVLKIPHHGGRTSSTPDFLARVRPQVAVVSAGYRNRFRHPHPEALERYRDIGARVFRTDLHGAVTVEMDGEHVVVRPFVGEPLAVVPGMPPPSAGDDGYLREGAPALDADVSTPDIP